MLLLLHVYTHLSIKQKPLQQWALLLQTVLLLLLQKSAAWTAISILVCLYITTL
jgi:hypothetical protein